MRKTGLPRRAWALALALLLALALAPGAAFAADSADTMRLESSSGTVTVRNKSGQKKTVFRSMQLFSGWTVETGEKSYATLSLDGSKAVRLDAGSKVELRQNDAKKLELFLEKGSLITDTGGKLPKDESCLIRTSTMVCGIRGTIVYVQAASPAESSVTMLESFATLSLRDRRSGALERSELHAGERADCLAEGAQLRFGSVSAQELPGFVQAFVAEEPGRAERIFESTGGALDLRDVTPEAAAERLAADEAAAAAQRAQRGRGAAVSVWDDGADWWYDPGPAHQPVQPEEPEKPNEPNEPGKNGDDNGNGNDVGNDNDNGRDNGNDNGNGRGNDNDNDNGTAFVVAGS